MFTVAELVRIPSLRENQNSHEFWYKFMSDGLGIMVLGSLTSGERRLIMRSVMATISD